MTGEVVKKKAGRPAKFKLRDLDRMCEAVKGTRGIKSAICAKLGCDNLTLNAAIAKFPRFREACEAECERVLDVIEGNVFERAESGDDVGLMKWVLAKKGRHRGWGDDVSAAGEMNVELVADVVKGRLAARIETRSARAKIGGDFADGGESVAEEE